MVSLPLGFFGGGVSFVFWFMSISQLSPDPQSSLNGLFTSLGFFWFFWFMSISLPSLDPQSSHNGLFISLFFCFVFLNNFVCGCFGVLCPFFLVQQQWSLLFSGFLGMFFCFLIIIISIIIFLCPFPCCSQTLSPAAMVSLPLWVFGGLF